MTVERWQTLPCGRHPERLIDIVADRTPLPAGTHEATCPYCQAALVELNELWHPVRQWAQQPVDLPRAFLATVIARVRKLVQSPHHVAATTAKGTTTVTSWVLGLIAATVTQNTTGVARITAAPTPRGASWSQHVRYGADGVDVDEVGAAAIALTVGITAETVPNLNHLADHVRANVITAIAADTHIDVARVDLNIDDLTDPPKTITG